MARALDADTLPERLLSAYLRVMPGGAAWLQAALGAQVQRVVEESERGLCLMADAMDAYLSLPAALKAEVDRDVERGEVAALGEHLHVVEVLSARGAALCTSCEALLEGVLRAAPAAPAGLRRIARALRAAGSAEGGEGGAGGGAGAGAVPVSAGGDGGEGGELADMQLAVELLFLRYLVPALTQPEAYGEGRAQPLCLPWLYLRLPYLLWLYFLGSGPSRATLNPKPDPQSGHDPQSGLTYQCYIR